jgi:hypothetical protein
MSVDSAAWNRIVRLVRDPKPISVNGADRRP